MSARCNNLVLLVLFLLNNIHCWFMFRKESEMDEAEGATA